MTACPFCGAEPPADHANPEGWVIAHATSKTDKNHKGVGGQQVRAMLDAQAGESPPESGRDTHEEASKTGAETPEETETADPAMGGPSGDGSATSSDDGCPECGGSVKRDISGSFYQPEGADEGQFVGAEDGDALCVSCGLLIDGGDGSATELVAQ